MATGYFVVTVTLFDGITVIGTATTNGVGSGKSGWFHIGRLLSPTVTIQNLETGGSISIRVTNLPEGIFPNDIDDGVPHNVLGAVTQAEGAGLGGAFTWIKAIKIAGGTPLATEVYLQAQQAK